MHYHNVVTIPPVQAWCETYNMTETQLIEGISLYYQLINLLFSKSRKTILTAPLPCYFFNKHKSEVIRKKVLRSSSNNIYSFDKWMNKEESLDKFTQCVKNLELSVSPKKTGLLRALSQQQYMILDNVHYFLSEKMDNYLFDLRNLGLDIIRYLFMCNTLSQGFNHKILNESAMNIMDNKPDKFFDNGFPFDFFVHDRDCSTKNKLSVIVCYTDRLSTFFFDNLEEGDKHIKASKDKFLLALSL
ncbi:hypothetical protein [Aliivibrio fischeri]|uniref:hypothetical protein n=1 Tax=Aliivibrio fischeri TaxID=668 RepID=UPI0007C5D838|nr:hypothetical protein [Aliivibrio fischeri]